MAKKNCSKKSVLYFTILRDSLIFAPLRFLKCFISARIAQLVEHDLAKVGVAGSSPVSRS